MGVVVRFEVEDVGGGSAVARVMNPEVGDTAPDLQISAVVPLRDNAHTPAHILPVIEDSAPDKRSAGRIKGVKGQGISWYWVWGEAGRGYDWVKVVFAVRGLVVTWYIAPRHRVEGERRGFFRDSGQEVIAESGTSGWGVFSPRTHVLSKKCRKRVT